MTDLISDIPPRVAAVVAQDQSILDVFGMRVMSAQDGACEINCVVPETLINAAGFAHGSIAFSLMDTACAYALGSLDIRGVTLNGNTTYVRGAQAGSTLRARVSVVSRTRRIVSLRGEVFVESDAGSELAAHGTFVFQLIEVKT
ncbi:MAG: PaaI family thioesterase [Pseudomonadales bacterium]